MEEVDLQEEKVELQDDAVKCSGSMEKVELRDDDSFEVISIPCSDSSKCFSDECEDDDALVISISDSMNKSFPKIQLSSDLIQSTPSTTTITAEDYLPDDKQISPEVGLTPEIKCESCSDDVSSAPLSQDDQSSSIIQLSEPSKIHEPLLSTKYASLSVPSLNRNEPDLQPLVEDINVLDFYGEHANVPKSMHVVKKSATTIWTTRSSVTIEKYSSEDAIKMSYDGENLHNSPRKLHSIFGGEQLRNAQFSASVHNFQAEGSDVSNTAGTKKSSVKNDVSVSHLPKVQNSPTGIWAWLCPRNLLSSIVNKAWASIDAVITTLDPQMKSSSSGVKPDFEILVTTASDMESLPVRRAFRKTFLGKVAANHLSVMLGCIPVQPVGFQSGVFCAESRIKFMREHRLVERNKIIVATSPVLVEVTPQRWHHTTCLMLDDPSLALTFHTFTQTVPVPNIYANQVQLRTPADYHLKHLGCNITVGRVISIMLGIPENDWQYTMTGISFNKILESAAVVLAGMYKSYVNGVSG